MRKKLLEGFLLALATAVLALLGNRQLPAPTPPDPPTAPAPTPPTAPTPTSDPLKAIGKLVMFGGSCSATVVTAPDGQGQQLLLSAAHCVKSVGETCQYFTRSGQMVACRVKSINRGPDISILETEMLRSPLPFLLVAATSPPAGAPVMHAGFGVHVPGNVERGRVLQSDTGNGQIMFELSVSPGDSGGGICLDGQGRVISAVCCTTRIAAVGQVYGGRPEEIQRMMLLPAAYIDVKPMAMPAPPSVKQ